MTNTNIIISGSGTASDPYIYNFHPHSETVVLPHFMLYAVLIAALLAAGGGFVPGFYFGKRRRKST
jgi:hypothetical protein